MAMLTAGHGRLISSAVTATVTAVTAEVTVGTGEVTVTARQHGPWTANHRNGGKLGQEMAEWEMMPKQEYFNEQHIFWKG